MQDQWIEYPPLSFCCLSIAEFVIGNFGLQNSGHNTLVVETDSTILNSRSSRSTSDVKFRMPPHRPAATLGE
jgi:hypothetical protein